MSTVGYGDISPTNKEEVVITIFLVLIGVIMYSYIISRLTRVFADLQLKSEQEERAKLLDQFIHKSIPDESLRQRVVHFFQGSEDNIIHMSKDYGID